MPTRQQIHIDRALTNISVAYMQDASNFIADKVFPTIGVQKQSDTYFVYGKEDFFRDDARLRAKGTESAGGTYEIETADPYFCRVFAYHTDVNEQDRVNADSPLQPNQDATELVSQKLLLRRENLWAQNFFKADVWGRELQGVDATPTAGQALKFDQPTSDPIKFFTDEATRMAETTGKKPNTIVMSPYVINALSNHPDILDRIKYTQRGIVTRELLATVFDVENIYVPYGIQNVEAKGKSAKLEFIMGKHALLMYVEKNPGIKKVSAGYTFAWTGLKGAGALGNRISRIPMPWLGEGTERLEAEMALDMRVIGADLGVFMKDMVN